MESALKGKIIEVSWQLFNEQGYNNTTIDEIIEACGTTKGGFYHHFRAKDDLLKEVSNRFDREYRVIYDELDSEMDSYDKLVSTTKRLFTLIQNEVPIDMLSLVYSTQIIKQGERHLLDRNREYFKVLYELVEEGQNRNQITKKLSISELVNIYAMQERAILYDWCMSLGAYRVDIEGVNYVKLFTENIFRDIE